MAAAQLIFTARSLALGLLVLWASCSSAHGEDQDRLGPAGGGNTGSESNPRLEAPNARRSVKVVSDDVQALGDGLGSMSTEERSKSGRFPLVQSKNDTLHLEAMTLEDFLNMPERVPEEMYREHASAFLALASKWQSVFEEEFRDVAEELSRRENELSTSASSLVSCLSGPEEIMLQLQDVPAKEKALAACSRAGERMKSKLLDAAEEFMEFFSNTTAQASIAAAKGKKGRDPHGDAVMKYPFVLVENGSFPLISSVREITPAFFLPKKRGDHTTSDLVEPSMHFISVISFLRAQCNVCIASFIAKVRKESELAMQEATDGRSSSGIPTLTKKSQVSGSGSGGPGAEVYSSFLASPACSAELNKFKSLLDCVKKCLAPLAGSLQPAGVQG